jgi:hypothetical protein
MSSRIQAVAIVAAFLLVVLGIELVRRRRLNERYALLWLLSAVIILGLAIWQGLLEKLAKLVGIAYPPNALFLVAVAFILLLLLNFSAALSRLQDQTRILAQRLAILEARNRHDDDGSSAVTERAHEPVGDDDPPASH